MGREATVIWHLRGVAETRDSEVTLKLIASTFPILDSYNRIRVPAFHFFW